MKNLTLIFAGMLLFATPVSSELSDSDLQRIREVVQIAVAAEGKQTRTEMKISNNVRCRSPNYHRPSFFVS